MFYFFLIAFFIFYISCQIIAEYKLKAIKTGEADLSLIEKNILPACRSCKFCAVTTFFILLFSGIILLFAPAGQIPFVTEWNALSLTKQDWQIIHFVISIVFILTFGFHIYIHWKWASSFIKGIFIRKT